MMKILILLVAVAVGSALGVVYAKYRSRLLFAEIQKLEQEMTAYDEELGLLQLEQNTLAEHSRIERVARARLSMELPERDSIIRIKP